MSMFKTKNKKNVITDSRITLDAKHNEMIQKMVDEKKKIPEKKKKIEELLKQKEKLILQDKTDWNDNDWNNKYNLDNQIDILKKEIEKNESNDDITNYFLDTAHLLYQYYNQIDIIDEKESISNKKIDLSYLTEEEDDDDDDDDNYSNQIKQIHEIKQIDVEEEIVDENKKQHQNKKKVIFLKKEENIKGKRKNVLDFFKMGSLPESEELTSNFEKEKIQEENLTPNDKNNILFEGPYDDISISNKKIDEILLKTNEKEDKFEVTKDMITMSDYLDTNQEIKFHRSDLLDEYLKIVDINYIPNKPKIYNYDYCSTCKIEKILYPSEGTIICEKCGEVDFVMVESDKPSYKDPPPEVSYFAYLSYGLKSCMPLVSGYSDGKNIFISCVFFFSSVFNY